MKLGFVLYDYFPFGGLQRDCLRVAQLCTTRGHAVTIIARTWQGDPPEKIQVHLLGRKGFDLTLEQEASWCRSPFFDHVLSFQ